MPPNSPSPDRLGGSTNVCLSTPRAPCTSATISGQPKDQAARSMHAGGVTVDGTPLKMGFISLEPAQGAVPLVSAVIAAGRFSIGATHGMQP
jgi:hypothetical protein